MICGIVGRLHPEKFPRDFAQALHEWDHGAWELRIIGRGNALEWQTRFKKDLADLPWVTFHPDVPPSEIVATYRQLDALLVPTPPETGETACYSAVEAMACGVPIVARDLPGLRQSCRDAALYGLTNELLLVQLRRLDNLSLRQEMSRRGVRVANAIHDIRSHVEVHSKAFVAALPVDVSVLTSVYNTDARHLNEYWESLRQQTLRRWEAVIIDDASTKRETRQILEKIAEDPRVRFIRLEKNAGGGPAKIIGLQHCRAELIAVLDSDDIAYPERLEQQRHWLRARTDVGVLGAQLDVFEDVTYREMYTTRHPEVITRDLIEEQRVAGSVWFLNHPTTMYRKQLVIDAGGYSHHTVCHDLALWLKLFKRGVQMRNLPNALCRYRIHKASLTQSVNYRLSQYNDVLQLYWEKNHGTASGR